MPITAKTTLSTKYGDFRVAYHKFLTNSFEKFCISISIGNVKKKGCLVRVHSSCLFSESLNAVDCDCALQLDESMRLIGKKGGVIIYLYQEGRGLGLENKIKAMELERVENIDTVEAFTKLHFELDPREYHIAALALKELGVHFEIRLISNNLRKKSNLEKDGFKIMELVKLTYPINSRIKKYLRVKKEKLGHLL